MRIVLDIETTTTTVVETKRKNPSPYLPSNKLVSVGWTDIDSNVSDYVVVNHNELPAVGEYAAAYACIQNALHKATLVVGHNLKFDMSWLYECGFTYEGELYDTMIAEYVFSKGLKIPLSLSACCERYGLSAKSDVLMDYFAKGYNTDAIPLAELVEYGKQDIISTKELYVAQQKAIAENPDHQYMLKSVNLMNQTLPVIIEMERAGIHIDLEALDGVEQEYRKEYNELKTKLETMVVEVMGHTPINLDSSEHLSWVLYSRKVLDKTKWKELFNLGSEVRNSVVKTKYATRYPETKFREIVRDNTEKLYKTEAKQCSACEGRGFIRKVKANGEAYKKDNVCKDCTGAGFLYIPCKSYAGFKLAPLGSQYASTGGFSTDKITINELLAKDISPRAKEFLTALLRINAISTYLTTFVEGIKKNTRDNILHTSFNQCITATGRLSSSNPNFHNLPRASTFPVRKVLTSRFKDGSILSADFAQLEFRVAAILGDDAQAKSDILGGADIHQFTANTITSYGQPTTRQEAKVFTFKPLFSGQSGTDAEKKYFKEFNLKYAGIARWQTGLLSEALNTRQIKSPSGRIYAFPQVRRLPSGYVQGQTQIYNYIIQGFATGDITPIAMIEVQKRIKKYGLHSRIILAVHDDLSCDCHPEESDMMQSIYREVFDNMNNYVEEYFGIKTDIPIAAEMSVGVNWLDKKVIH